LITIFPTFPFGFQGLEVEYVPPAVFSEAVEGHLTAGKRSKAAVVIRGLSGSGKTRMGLEVARALYKQVHAPSFRCGYDEVVYLDFFVPEMAESVAVPVEEQAKAYHDANQVNEEEKLRLTTGADLILAWALVEKLAQKGFGPSRAPAAAITFASALERHIPIDTAEHKPIGKALIVIHLDEAQHYPHLAPFLVRVVVAHNRRDQQRKVLLLLSGTWISDLAWEKLIGVSPVQEAVKVVDLGFVPDQARQIVANAALACRGFRIDDLQERTALAMLIEDTRGWAQACVQLGSQLNSPGYPELGWLATVEKNYYNIIKDKYRLAAKVLTADGSAENPNQADTAAKLSKVTLLHSNLMTQKLGAFALCPYQVNIAETINGGTLKSCLEQGLYKLASEEGGTLANVQMARSMVAVLNNLRPAKPIHVLFAPQTLLPHDCLYTLHDTYATSFEQIQLYSLINAIEAVHAMEYKDHLAKSSLRPGALFGLGAELPISLATGSVYVLAGNCFPTEKVIADALKALEECLHETVILAAFTPIGTQGIDSWIRFADGTFLYLQSKGAMMETEKALRAKRAVKQGKPAPGYEVSFGPAELKACLARIHDVLRKHKLPNGLYEVATIKRAPRLCRRRDIPPRCVFICNRAAVPRVDALEPVFGHIPARMFWRAAEVAELQQVQLAAAAPGGAAGKTARLASSKSASRRPQEDEDDQDDQDEAANRRWQQDQDEAGANMRRTHRWQQEEDEEPKTAKRRTHSQQEDQDEAEAAKRRTHRRHDEELQAQAGKAGRLRRADASVDEYGASAAVEDQDEAEANMRRTHRWQQEEDEEPKTAKRRTHSQQEDQDEAEAAKRRTHRRHDEELQAQTAPGRLWHAHAGVDHYGASAAVGGAAGAGWQKKALSAKRRSDKRREKRKEKKSKQK